MGMSASQGRLLTLAARRNNLEFQIQKTTQAKMLLASQLDAEATLWSNGMNIQHLYYSPDGCDATSTADMQRLSYQLVTKDIEDGGLGKRVTDSYGRIVVKELPDPMPEDKTVGDYVVEPYCTQADYFETNLKTGNWAIQSQTAQGNWVDEVLEGSSFVYQGVDSEDFAIANREYEEKTEKLQRIDKRYDMQISQLSNEQNAVQTEMESVRKVIDKNIDQTFKTFG